MRTTGSVTHACPGTIPAESDVGADHRAASDADVALVDDRRGREADHAAVAERPEARRGCRGRSPRAPGSPPTRGARARRPPASPPPPRCPRRVRDRGPSQHGRRALPGRGTMARVTEARIVQISDTHLSAAGGVPPPWPAAMAGADPPDLVVHSGDIVYEDPDDVADREFARRLHEIASDLVVIPGNHDVGFYGEDRAGLGGWPPRSAPRGATTASSVTSPGGASSASTRTCSARGPRRLVPAAVAVDQPVLVFVHQPVRGDRADGWRMSDAARRRVRRRRRPAPTCASWRPGTATASSSTAARVWAPSLTLRRGRGRRSWAIPPSGSSSTVLTGRTVGIGTEVPSGRGSRATRQVDGQHDDQHDAVEDGVGEDRRADAAQEVGGRRTRRRRRRGRARGRCCRRRRPCRRGRAEQHALQEDGRAAHRMRLRRPRRMTPRNTISSTIGAAMTAVMAWVMT